MKFRTANEQPEGAWSSRGVPLIDRTRLCFYCAGEATEYQRLVRDGDYPERLVHEWRPCTDALNEAGDVVYRKDGMPKCGHDECSEEWFCPPPPAGFGTCAKCRRAYPIGHLVASERQVIQDGEPTWLATTEGRYPRALFLCTDGCREARRAAQAFKQVTARAIDRDDSRQDQDEARFDLVPNDGDGLDRRALSSLWDVGDSTTRNLIARGVETSRLRVEERPTRAGGVPRKVYWRVDA